MRKLICLFFTACLFASCNDGILFDDYLNELGYEFKETNLSALDVLTSADYWEDNYLENVYSTKPNCEGKVYKPKDHLMPVGGSHKTTISVTLDRIRFYNIDSSGILSAPYNHYYSDSPIAHIDNNEIVFESGNVWKIVRYDEKKIVLDIHMPDFQFGGDHYPYGRIILHKKTGRLDDKYVSYEESMEAYRQKKQEYWESKTIEYLEDYVADELASGRSTLEQLHRYFQYYCPELYESTIKYILEKYK
jgi:hypothetical protein